MAKTGFTIVKNTLKPGTKKFYTAVLAGGKVDKEAKKAVAELMLDNTVNGSANVSIKAPILTGRLRASASVFVGSILIKTSAGMPVSEGRATPNKGFSAPNSVITIGFNTPYAARWHENSFNPGPVSVTMGPVGNKYLEQHLKGDAKSWTKSYAQKVKEGLSKL